MTSNEVGDCNSIDVGYLYCGLPEGDDQVTGPIHIKMLFLIHDSHGEQAEIVFEKRYC